MDSEDTPKLSKKIRIYPNRIQQKCFLQWFGGNRAAFNLTNEYLKQPGSKANWMNIKTDLLKILSETKPYLNDVPYQIKSLAIKECCIAVSSAKKKYKITGQYQEISFKKFRSPKQSCYIPKSAIKDNSIYVDILSTYIAKSTNTKKDKSNANINITEKIPDNFGDSRLVLENGRWFLCVSYEDNFNPQIGVSQSSDVETQDNKIVSLDPGIRSFMTFYSQDSCGKLGEGAFTEIQKLGFELDFLLSIKKKTNKKLRFKKRNFQKAIMRTRNRIKDLVSEMHHKVALFLVQNFDIILLPKFETQQMVTKNSRKLNSKSARNMMTFAFYKFSLILKAKAKKYGKVVLDVQEEYTSKTVSWNGEIKEKLGSASPV
jgi:putative transposase